MTRARALVAASAVLVLGLSACATSGSGSAGASRPPATPVQSATAPAASVAATSVLSDALGILRGQGARVVESTETSRLDAAAAIRKVVLGGIGGTMDSTTTVVTATKARLTDDSIARNRLVWVIGIAPVLEHSHGPVPLTLLGRRAVVIDANTGASVESADTFLGRWTP